MQRSHLCTALILLTGCAAYQPSPEECRSLGVAVDDQDSVTGTIVHAEERKRDRIYAVCKQVAAGCARSATLPFPAFPDPLGRYNIYYTDHLVARHEMCHALYEKRDQ